MSNKNNSVEDNKIFKVKNDGTIVRVDETSNSTTEKKQKNGFGIAGFTLSLFALIFFIIIVGILMYEYEDANFTPSEYANKAISFSEYLDRDLYPFIFNWFFLFFTLLFSTIFSLIGLFKRPRWIAGFVISATVLLSAIVLCVFYYSELAYYTVYQW